MEKKIYIYSEPELMSYTEFIQHELPEYSEMNPGDLQKIVQVYSMIPSYYVNSNWET